MALYLPWNRCPVLPWSLLKLGVDAVQLPHADGQIPVGSLDQKMVMVGHEAVGVADPVVALVDVLEGVEEVQTIRVGLENGFLLVPAGGHMIDCAGVFDAERTGHGRTLAEKRGNVKPQDLTPRSPGRLLPALSV